MDDNEVLCTWMTGPAPKVPPPGGIYDGMELFKKSDWWEVSPHGDWRTKRITLNECHLIEARLSGEMRLDYMLGLTNGGPPEQGYWMLVHADAPTKVRCLAAVLRKEVEG